MTRILSITTLVLGLVLATSALAAGQESGGYKALAGDYESIRQALLHDGTEGVAAHAESIREVAEHLHLKFDATTAAIPAERSAECLEVLQEIQNVAARLTSANTLEGLRAAFGELSKAMVRYRQMLIEPDSIVVYCAMAGQVWIQPQGEIGNPYYGQSMARCGEVISK